MESIILCGGLGTRMQNINNNIPKSLLKIEEKPFLYWIIKQLQVNKIKKIILCLGIKHELIMESINNFKFDNLEIEYFIEQEQLGTGGALIKVINLINSKNFIFMNGDSIFNIPIRNLYDMHVKNGNALTYSLKKLEVQNTDYGGIDLGKDGQIRSHIMGESDSTNKMIDAGLRVINKQKVLQFKKSLGVNKQNLSFENEIAPELIKTNKVCGIEYDLDFFDIGNPQSYENTKSNFAKIKYKLECHE